MAVSKNGEVIRKLASISLVAVSIALPALADKQNPAPIIYGAKDLAPRAMSTPSYLGQATDPTSKTDRVSIIYPGASQVPAPTPAQKQIAALPKQQVLPRATDQSLFQQEQALPAPNNTQIVSEDMAPIRITAKADVKTTQVAGPLSVSSVSARSEASLTDETGFAGIYGDGFQGQPTANGEIFDAQAMTAAHPNLPLPSLVQVINQENNREVVVRVNDRGPFEPGRLVDLSPRAASVLGIEQGKKARVTLRYLGPAPVKTLNGAKAPVAPKPAEPSVRAPVVYTPKQPAAPKPDPIEAGKLYIQVGAFTDIANAEQLNSALGRKLPVKIEQALVRNTNFFRVLVGPFDKRSEAETYQSHIEDAGIVAGFVVER